MRKSLLTQIVCGVVVVPAWFSYGQVAPPPASSTPAAQPEAPPVMDQKISAIPLRMLPDVQDVRQHNTPWEQAADQAVGKIGDPALKSSVSQQLSKIAPQVAKALLAHPGESAMVTIAVYRQRDTSRAAAAAVAFEGLDDALNPSFYPRVLANFPQPPGVPNTSAPSLELDPTATSYLCFFLDHGDLKAGNISHEQMKRSLDVAIEQSRRQSADRPITPPPQDITPDQPAAAGAPPVAASPAPANPANVGEAQPASSELPPDYANPYWASNDGSSPYYGTDGWIPWFSYLPAYGQQPIVVQPDYRHHHNFAGNVGRGTENADLVRDRSAAQAGGGLNRDITPSPAGPINHAVNPSGPVPGPAIPSHETGTVARPAEIGRDTGPTREPARAEPAPASPGPVHAEPAPAARGPAPASAAEHAGGGGGGAPAPAAEHSGGGGGGGAPARK